jgi:glyoxylase-like metal-dependent hydrolase (beta-lactamase superfamily II)
MAHVTSWRAGRSEVAVVCEGFAPLAIADELPGAEVDWDAERAAYPWAFMGAGLDAWPWHVHAFWIDTPSGVLVVDTGLGSFPPFAPWAEQAPDPWAGRDLSEVDDVVLTHLHADHAGGSLRGEEPRFPNARYHLHRADQAHFAHADDAEDYVARRAMERLEELGMLSVEEADAEIVPGVRVLHTPGHTPGHRSVVLADGDATMLITGDALHHPAQVRLRDRPSSHDEDPETGARSRKALLDGAEARGWLVGVQHFAEPFGTVVDGRWRAR